MTIAAVITVIITAAILAALAIELGYRSHEGHDLERNLRQF